MNDSGRSNRFWIRRVRTLRDRVERQREGVCFVEGIRQVLAATEGDHPLEALLIDPRRLRSEIALRAVHQLRESGTTVVELTTSEFERISARDNPAGIAAIVEWTPGALADLPSSPHPLYLVTDQISDAGNLGTLIRTADSLGVSAIIVHAGVDPAHPTTLRASLGTAFRVPIASVPSLDDFFDWAKTHSISTVATSARAPHAAWDVNLTVRTAILMGSEGTGLAAETVDRCDETVLIPMSGTATSLNVGVAAGILLYEAQRQRAAG